MLYYTSPTTRPLSAALVPSTPRYLSIPNPPPSPLFTTQNLPHQTFLSNLTSGVTLILAPSKKTRQQIKCHILQPSSPVLYFFRKNGDVNMIDIGSCEVIAYHLRYEVAWNLQQQEYLIIKQNSEDHILLFPTREQKIFFYNNLVIMKKNAEALTADDNWEFVEAFSLFRKYSKTFNMGNTIRYQQFLLCLSQLGYCNGEKIDFIIRSLYHNTQPQFIGIRGFQTFLRLYYCKFGCYPVFQKYCQNAPKFVINAPTLNLMKPIMTKVEFQNFLINEQCQSQIDTLRIIGTLTTEAISYYQFCKYIFSKYNDINRIKVTNQDLNHPLNHYYLLSSHNSYLVGNQLTSKSKRRRYIQDLQNGYRCIQLDVHDSAQGPLIHHRFTLTSSIFFEDVIMDINKFSNSNVHTPIILSIETHCKPMGRYQMASIMFRHFGSKILVVDKTKITYPKLSSLMNRIILKGHHSLQEMSLMPKQAAQSEFLRSLTGIYKDQTSDELQACAKYVSFSSSGFASQAKNKPKQVLLQTSRSWMRIYPNGINFCSENFNPILGLEMGVQMIAINSQNNDIWKLILQSYFYETRLISAGYCLKSPYLAQGQVVPATPIKLVVQVISANNIRFFNHASFSYYVKMAFFGSEEDNIVGNNSQLFIDVTNSVSGEEGVFANSIPIAYILKQPSFGFIVFQIPQYGRAAIAIKNLKSGYRTIQLLDDNLNPILHSSLLIKTYFSY